MANTCLSCRSTAVRLLVDLGPQPPSNRFESAGGPDTSRHPLTLGQCLNCGLLQLTEPMPPRMVKARVDWLAYNEPEGHLDDVVSRLAALPEVTRDARIVGLTYKDDTMLRRFNDLGFSNTYRYDTRTDLGIDDSCAGLESIQAALYPDAVKRLLAQHGAADLLLARHVLEHAHDPMNFLAQLRHLVKPSGHILFEVPDAVKFVEACDYAFLWEEHITYFARPTMAAMMTHARLPVVAWMIHPYPLEELIDCGCAEYGRRGSSARPDTYGHLGGWRGVRTQLCRDPVSPAVSPSRLAAGGETDRRVRRRPSRRKICEFLRAARHYRVHDRRSSGQAGSFDVRIPITHSRLRGAR